MFSFFSSIRTKTAVLFFAAFLAIILPVHWLIYRKVKQALVAANYREMREEAERLLSQVRLDPFIVPLPAEGYLLSLQVHQHAFTEKLFTSPDFPSLNELDFLQTSLQTDTFELVNVYQLLPRQDTRLILSLARSSTILQEQLTSLQFYLFLAISIAIALAAILVFLVSGWILRPLKLLTRSALAIKSSNDISSIPLPQTNDESRRLAEAINAMLQRINLSLKAQTNFFASAAHELRTPLAVMKSELTMVKAVNSEQQQSSMLREVERLERVIHDFLLISELKADTLTIRKTSESLTELLYAALKKLRFASNEYGVTLQVNIEEDATCLVWVDADKIETVIANLVENAIKYSPRQSNVTVTLLETSVGFALTVNNTIKDAIEDPSILIQEFKKANSFSSGLGMGLWICNQIVSLHGGLLKLSSTNHCFTARLEMKNNPK